MGPPGQTWWCGQDGLSVRVPRAWYVPPGRGRHRTVASWKGKVLVLSRPLEMAQTDYLAGGRDGAWATLVTARVAADMTADAMARKAIEASAYVRGRSRTLEAAAASLGGHAGRQYVVQCKGAEAAEGLETFVIARAACASGRGGPDGRRGCALVLRCRAAGAEPAAAMMDRLAEGVQWAGQAATAPASRPASAPRGGADVEAADTDPNDTTED
jgi:hypothetical protein